MEKLLSIFNTREIAIGIWFLIALLLFLCSNKIRRSLKKILVILFNKKFIFIYIIFSLAIIGDIWIFKRIKIWNDILFKDIIFWVVFVEMPILGKALTDANDFHFFHRLIKDNMKVAVILESYFNFWTFQFWVEFILVPAAIFLAIMYTIASMNKQYQKAKSVLDGLLILWAIIVFVTSIQKTLSFPEEIFMWNTLISWTLPALLLFLNLPLIYGCVLYSGYEQLFIRIKSGATQKGKIRLYLFLFSKFNITKIALVRHNLNSTLGVSLDAETLRERLIILDDYASKQIGDNYMKHSNCYISVWSISIIVSIIGLILANSEVPIKDILTFNFVIDFSNMKRLFSDFFTISLALGIIQLIKAIFIKKKKSEEISQIKKYAMWEYLSALKKQKDLLQEYPPIDDPISLFINYLLPAYEVKNAAVKTIDGYGNLLKSWEREIVEHVNTVATSVMLSVDTDKKHYSYKDGQMFSTDYKTNVSNAHQQGDYNAYTFPIRKAIEKYNQCIEQAYEEFKSYY